MEFIDKLICSDNIHKRVLGIFLLSIIISLSFVVILFLGGWSMNVMKRYPISLIPFIIGWLYIGAYLCKKWGSKK